MPSNSSKLFFLSTLFLVFFSNANAAEKLDSWGIEIYPYDSFYNPISLVFKGKLYNKGKGVSLAQKKELDNSERFLSYVIQTYKTGAITDILELWHIEEREKMEFLGKDKFHIEEKKRLNAGNTLEIRLLSRIKYGNILIYHVLSMGLEKNRVIRYTLIQSENGKSGRYFLTKKLENRKEFYLFQAYTNYLEEEAKLYQAATTSKQSKTEVNKKTGK